MRVLFKVHWWLHYENKNMYYQNKYKKVVKERGEDTANPNYHFNKIKIIALKQNSLSFPGFL